MDKIINTKNTRDIRHILRTLYLPPKSSHKGQNGKLLIIGGSKLFHSASLWALKVASRFVDLVHYSSVPENNRIVEKLNEEFRDGIVIPRSEAEDYIKEDDCILIGPGMVRTDISDIRYQISDIKEILDIKDEGLQTYHLTKYLLRKYPDKRWVIDAGALQMLYPQDIPPAAILTPHRKEWERLLSKIPSTKRQITNKLQIPNSNIQLIEFSKKYNCTVLLKGETDYIASLDKFMEISGGNAGMTKGGTGDVLAGLVAGLYCKNDSFTSAVAASYINKRAGEELFEKAGYWFNASDLADQIPKTLKALT